MLRFKSLWILAIAFVAIQALSTLYIAMRMATYAMQNHTASKISVLQILPNAIDIYLHDQRGSLQADIKENYKTRTFVLDYLTLILEREEDHTPLYGDDLRRALVVATPRLLYPGKFRDEFFETEEPLINPRLGLPVWDAANSILTGGAADFGLAGLFSYPLILCILYSLALRTVRRFAPPLATLLTGLALCQILLSVESDISLYFSSVISTSLILLISWVAFYRRAQGS
jgi:hypothetical protein